MTSQERDLIIGPHILYLIEAFAIAKCTQAVVCDLMVDDDSTKVTLHPTQLNVPGGVETSVHVKITLLRRYTMTVDELRDKVATLQIELQTRVGQGQHIKSASANVRKILGEIKNAVPQLRRDLVELDKK